MSFFAIYYFLSHFDQTTDYRQVAETLRGTEQVVETELAKRRGSSIDQMARPPPPTGAQAHGRPNACPHRGPNAPVHDPALSVHQTTQPPPPTDAHTHGRPNTRPHRGPNTPVLSVHQTTQPPPPPMPMPMDGQTRAPTEARMPPSMPPSCPLTRRR
jgi:hypothetical protein